MYFKKKSELCPLLHFWIWNIFKRKIFVKGIYRELTVPTGSRTITATTALTLALICEKNWLQKIQFCWKKVKFGLSIVLKVSSFDHLSLLSFSLSHTHTLSLCHTHSLSLSLSHTLSLCHTHSLSLTHTHTHSLSFSLSHTHTHTHSPFFLSPLSLSPSFLWS